mmetsp:Transcript_70239/g.132503  ORF Transcript_70239/g.132503 Transcript_70239/m.132503 type:complete len:260 (+) Transcript_70239:71-850(+)
MTLPKLLLTATLFMIVSISQGTSIKTDCHKGVCHGEETTFFSVVDSSEKCKMACLNANWKKHDCKYYTYSNVTGYCFQYKECPTVDIEELVIPPNSFLAPGDLSTYSTCKFTQYVVETWLDLKGKPTKQSSEGWGGRSSRAVDGNKRNDWGGRSCTHTHTQNNAWWEVDLQEPTDIGSVELVNRRDCCWDRLKTFKILVDGKECTSDSSTSRGEYKLVKCGVTGQKMRIQLKNRNALTLCEVGIRKVKVMDLTNTTWLL